MNLRNNTREPDTSPRGVDRTNEPEVREKIMDFLKNRQGYCDNNDCEQCNFLDGTTDDCKLQLHAEKLPHDWNHNDMVYMKDAIIQILKEIRIL